MCAMNLYNVWSCIYLSGAAYGAQEEDHVCHEPDEMQGRFVVVVFQPVVHLFYEAIDVLQYYVALDDPVGFLRLVTNILDR